VSDSGDENRKVQIMHNLAESAIGQGASLSEISEMLRSNNIPEMSKKLQQIEENRAQMQQQAQQAEQQTELRKLQMELEQKYNEDRIKEEDSIRSARTDVEVALINSDDSNMQNAYKDELERAQLALKQEEARQKAEKLEEEKRQNRQQEQLKQRELELKAKQMRNQSTNK
jgi:hypothetical protein